MAKATEKKEKGEPKDDSVKVKILRGGTKFGMPGDIANVSKAEAKELTKIRTRNRGGDLGMEEFRIAKPFDEKDPVIPVSALTQGEMEALGMENKIKSPTDKALAAQLAKLPKKVLANQTEPSPPSEGEGEGAAAQ